MILVRAGEQFSETPCLAVLDPREIDINHITAVQNKSEFRTEPLSFQ
jgi:hypothetical protein